MLAGEQTTMQVVPDIGGRRQEHPSYMYASDKHREHYYYRPENGQKRHNYYFLLCRATVRRYVIFCVFVSNTIRDQTGLKCIPQK